MSLDESVSQLLVFKERFGFLFNIRQLSVSCSKSDSVSDLNDNVSDLNDNVSVSDVNDNLHGQCQLLLSLLCKPNVSTVDLVINDSPQLSNSANSDIDGTSLFDELHTLSNILEHCRKL